jgi:hypothetical protein
MLPIGLTAARIPVTKARPQAVVQVQMPPGSGYRAGRLQSQGLDRQITGAKRGVPIVRQYPGFE